jgi:hypothetical protein
MNKILMMIGLVFVIGTGCATSTEFTKVNPADISANGDAIAVMNANGFAVTFFFHLVQPWEEGSLKHVINKALVKQAKQLGGNKVELLDAAESPKNGLYALTGSIMGVSSASASGVAIK